MKEYYISSFSEIHEIFLKYKRDKNIIFRGQPNIDIELLPKIGRNGYKGADEKLIFESWKRRAIEFINIMPANNWEWLSIAQHHGMATRFLDWSKNPLNALFFAIEPNNDNDAVLYACKFQLKIIPEKMELFDVNSLAVYYPSGIVPRIVRQGGVFSYHPFPQVPIKENSEGIKFLERIIIKNNFIAKLKSELSYYGVNRFALFPDLDGLSSFINWTILEKEYWKFPDLG